MDPTRLNILRRWATVLGIAWTLLCLLWAGWLLQDNRDHAERMARMEARIHLSKDLSFRPWASSHGGVYVPVDSSTPPNPYLTRIAERDLISPQGKPLTLMNPAYIMRQFYSRLDSNGVRGSITSLQPLNPINAPDEWERQALERFAQGSTMEEELVGNGEQARERLLQRLIVEKSCLKCHAHQGYKEGDVRGGIGVSVRLAPYILERKAINRNGLFRIGTLWLLGLAGIVGSAVWASRLEAQRLLAERMAQRSQRYKAMGEAAGGIAHDFKNRLAIALMALDVAEDEVKSPEGRAVMTASRTALEQATQLARSLMDLARIEESAPHPIDFGRCIGEARAILLASSGSLYQWSVNVPTGITVIGWGSRLRNALIDLGLNAIQAMPEGGEIRIDWCQARLDQEFCLQSRLPIVPGEYLALTLADQGCGIPPENLPSLFDPYFTTKSNGTGLGLPSVIATLGQHHGTVTVSSVVGQGTSFTLYLPLSGTSGDPTT